MEVEADVVLAPDVVETRDFLCDFLALDEESLSSVWSVSEIEQEFR